ncbi:putative O-methyltransferase [Corynespora cassiicola Philippines]|uniref:Putative O-methyltransferase n=1 Tax=Corynespora cassiicola Philippines TaxID=1448308 RepID=A0A2T2P1G3_CORCC|nr:putative O-methyltransferase [Corynespora cassiicola Philippines]
MVEIRAPQSNAHGRLHELAEILHVNANEIESYLEEKNLPYPSFDIGASESLPPELEDKQHELLEAADELVALVQGPKQHLSTFAQEHNKTTSLHVIIRFKIASAVPLLSTTTFTELARSTGLMEHDLTQILRHAMTYRIFSEPSPGVVAHTAASRLLVTSPNLVNFIGIALDELLPSATRLVDAMQKWPNSQEPNEAGFNLAKGTSEPMFVVMNRDSDRATEFAGSMNIFLESPPFSPQHLIRGYEWSHVKKVVDIGGSSGSIATALAMEFEDIQFVVQDHPHAIQAAKVPHNVANRVKMMAHDMFCEQPILDADIYLLRFVLHDWSDAYAAKVLNRLVPALESNQNGGKRILINDACLPDWGTMSLYDQRFLRATSITMREIQNGRERDREDWNRVLQLADPRLVLKEVRTPEGSALSLLVVELENRTL